MKNLKTHLMAISASALLATGAAAHAEETLILGLTVPMSGAAATWGLGQEWAAKQAAQEINDAGGVTVDGKTYKFEVRAYDNKYNAAEGTKVAQTIINRDNARYVVGGIGTAPLLALQSLSERQGVLVFMSGWGKSLKGPDKPLTFTQFNTPFEILDPLYRYVQEQHPDIKTVAIVNPNDATGKETEPVAQEAWSKLGVETISVDWYERGTTQFQPVAQKLANAKPDVIDMGVTPPPDAGSLLRELAVLGWQGVKVLPVGSSAVQLIEIAGDVAEGTYMGLAADYSGPNATEKQRELDAGIRKVVGEPLNNLQISGYDAVYALKAGMEAADSLDSKAIAEALPTIIFETSYGKTAFGGTDTYGSPQQMLVPVIISQVRDGELVEIERIVPDELVERLKEAETQGS